MKRSLARISHFLLDMDGTLYLGNRLLPGAKAFLEGLETLAIPFLCFTNNPTSTASDYSKKLARLGIDVTSDEILTSGEATASYLAKETPYRRIHALGPPAFREELEKAGLTVVEAGQPDAVVLAFDTTLTYDRLIVFCRHVLAGLPYYATNPDLVCPTEDGPIPDCGAMAAMIECATGRVPQYIGKPEASMVQMGLNKLGAVPETTAMVGDRRYTDMEMAYKAGITAILVLSGETKAEDLRAAGERQPDYVFEHAGALWEALHESHQAQK